MDADAVTLIASDRGARLAGEFGVLDAIQLGDIDPSEVGTLVAAERGGLDASEVGTLVASHRAPPVAAGASYAPGHCIGQRYELVQKLGEGGVGSVWRALDTTLARDVAIKLIHDQHRASEIEERLRVEAQATAQINHPAIVRVYDVGETEIGEPYLVMELLRGESLASIADLRGRMPELSAVLMMLPIAGALVAAHAAGIVHRDIKPDNVMVVPIDGDGVARQPKLVDFGIARREDNKGFNRRLTVQGTLLGSPGYMAPEQAMGKLDADARVDVWAFSVVLYELVTGVMPFVRPSVQQSLAAIVQYDPEPTTEKGGDADLWAILHRGLAKDRSERWGSMAELRAALLDWARARGATIDVTGAPLVPSRPPSSRGSAPPAPVVVPLAPPPSFELAFEPPSVQPVGTLYVPAPPPLAAVPPLAKERARLSPMARIAAFLFGASVLLSGAVGLLIR